MSNFFLSSYVLYQSGKEMADKDISMSYMSSALVKERELEKKGYTASFKITEEGLMVMGSGKVYKQDELKIVEHSRYEGISNPDDMNVLYAVETKDGTKGIIIDAFGTYSDAGLSEFLKGVEDETVKNL